MELTSNDSEQAISDVTRHRASNPLLLSSKVSDDFQIHFSVLPDLYGKTIIPKEIPWERFCDLLKNPNEYGNKHECPLLKLARFGNNSTDKGSLRHDGNILEIFGIEGDYDGELISPEYAVRQLAALGIKAIVYTSPSHKPEKPRWRVLLPFSQSLSPDKREYWISLVNGLLDGVLAIESWTLSQAFYYGKVKGVTYQCHVLDGPNFLDNSCLDLIYSPIGKPTKEKQIDAGESAVFGLGERQEDAELVRQIMTGENYHHALLTLTARYHNRGITAKNIIDTVQGLMLGGTDRSDRWRARFADISRIVNDAVKKFTQEKKAQDFKLLPAHDFANTKPLEWLVKGVIPRAEIGTIYGASGVGKSFFSLDLVASIAGGKPWIGHKVKRSRIVYIVAEGSGGFKKRVTAYAKHQGINLTDLPIQFITDAPNFLKEDDPQAIAELINAEGQFDLIVIDTVSAVTPGANENSSEGMGLLINHCKYLHQATGATILLIDHSGKDASQGVRGWSGKYAAMDFVIEVTKKNDCSVAKIRKQKDGIEGAEFAFKLLRVDLGVDEDLDPITSCVIEHLDCQPTPLGGKSHKKPGAWEQRVIDAFNSLGPIGIPEGEIKIPVYEVINAAVEKAAIDPGKKDRRKEYATRAITSAAQKGFFSVQDDFVVLPG
ncbi:MAG: AAA family ATPase [Methylomicrobium sp.]